MKMGFRWFGERDDSVTLQQIRQIPGVTDVVGALHDLPAGEEWPAERVVALRDQIEAAGLAMRVVESVNVHDDIKIGAPGRDLYIDRYRETVRRLGAIGVEVICYNFMPIFDWLRTELAHRLPDGSFTMAYDHAIASGIDPDTLLVQMAAGSNGFSLPGWEPERLVDLRTLFDRYAGIDGDGLRANLRYFLEGVVDVCEEAGVTMAIHPDDPPHPMFGLPRVVSTAEDLQAVLDMVDHPRNGLTLCTGSLAANPANDVVAIVRRFTPTGRVPFAHLRNIRWTGSGQFHESAHLSREGSLDMVEIVTAFHESGFDGYVRPDHGRMIWGETGRPGYGLYDRALGAMYLQGIWEAVEQSSPTRAPAHGRSR